MFSFYYNRQLSIQSLKIKTKLKFFNKIQYLDWKFKFKNHLKTPQRIILS